MGVLVVILLGLAGAYASTLVWLYVGFRRVCRSAGERSSNDETRHPEGAASVSVIIPARNEADNIAACLESIFANDYPDFEVVLIDDASEDKTSEVARSFSTEHGLTDRLSIVQMAEPAEANATGHKKRAIGAGIEASRGDIIVTTDADSTVPKAWLRNLVDTFSENVDFVSAPVAYDDGHTIREQAVALEMLGLVAAGGGAIANGHPNMCNGANLAYRRSAFDHVGGFQSIDNLASGDDVLLMLKMFSQDSSSVRFCPSPDAIVITKAARGWTEFIRQRRRWASKGLHTGSVGAVAVALLVYVFHAALLISTISALFGLVPWTAVAAAFALKVASEGLLLYGSCHQYGRLSLLWSFIPAQFVHTIYVVVIGFLGVFANSLVWKGRELAR